MPPIKNHNLAPPIIVIGMHRSGTTLLTRMMEGCGVFWGATKDEYNETLCFQSINEMLFALSGGSWDNPLPVESYFEDIRHVQAAVASVQRCLNKKFYQEYFNGSQLLPPNRALNRSRTWGWKDPRNIFTLPVWLEIFPDARIIHIIRNGIDVAASLWLRETSRPEGSEHPHYSDLCQDQEGCYDLWKLYIKSARRGIRNLHNVLELRFEDLLENPVTVMHRIANFAGFETNGCLQDAAAIIKPERRLAFINDPTLKRLRDLVAKDRFWQELGYHPLADTYT